MDQYLRLVETVLSQGSYKSNRTGIDTIASFSPHYSIDLNQGFPLLTTKKLDGYRWKSLLHEFLWYLSGDAHIRKLQEETSIWDAWADENGNVDTAYGRYWRRYPIPENGMDGEAWPEKGHPWVNEGEYTFDQIQYVIDQLHDNPNSRRLVVTAWHPANAAVSRLPPCPYTFVFNVQGGTLNLHLTQRSGDIALGVPFNIASFSLLARVIAQRTGFELGAFSHTIVDAHIYCGEDDRGEWYHSNLSDLQSRLEETNSKDEYLGIREWIMDSAPQEKNNGYDHVPGLLLQLSRQPMGRPSIEIADKPIDDLEFDDIQLKNYESAEGIQFAIAE